MNKRAFLQQVTNHIKSKEAKEFVAVELDKHLEESVKQMVEAGLSQGEAENKAIQQMGSPDKIGVQMGRLHRPIVDWGLLGLVIFLQIIGILPFLFISNLNNQISIFSKFADTLLGIGIVLCVMLFDYRKFKNKAWLMLGVAGSILLLFFHLGIFSTFRNGYPSIHIGPFTSDTMVVIPLLFIGWAGIFHRAMHSHRKVLEISVDGKRIIHLNMYTHILMIGLFLLTLTLYMPVSSLSNVLLYLSMVFAMYVWTFRKQKKKVLGSMLAMLIILTGFYWRSASFFIESLLAFLHPERYKSGFMNMQIKKYLSESNWLGNPNTLSNFSLPEAHTDMVFVTLIYSFGWLFSIGLAIFLTAITIRMGWMTIKTPDTFGQLIIVGAVALYTVPFIYNIAMALGWLPLVGFSLPFISYGTLPVLINSIVIGLVLSVYRRKDLVTVLEK